MPWRTLLTRRLKPIDHAPFGSLADARLFIRNLPDDVARQPVWLRAMELLVTAASFQRASSVRAATDQVQAALLMTGRLDPIFVPRDAPSSRGLLHLPSR
jgi:hypothetical protein